MLPSKTVYSIRKDILSQSERDNIRFVFKTRTASQIFNLLQIQPTYDFYTDVRGGYHDKQLFSRITQEYFLLSEEDKKRFTTLVFRLRKEYYTLLNGDGCREEKEDS